MEVLRVIYVPLVFQMSRVDSGNESQEGSPDTTASEPALLHTPPRLSANLTQVTRSP
ncbi:unnamed protein product, partial [Nesidiocoris tenuis]